LDYEAQTYDPDARNWPDYRDSAHGGGFMMGWCAGAPGIALTRLRMLQLLPNAEQVPSWREDLLVAADTTAGAPLFARDHLCCGNLGNAAILRTLAAATSTTETMPGTADLQLSTAGGAGRAGGAGGAVRATNGDRWTSAANGIAAAVLGRPGETLPRSMLGQSSAGIPMPGLMTGLPGAGLVLLDIDPTTWVPQLLL
jgi:hypothetical protein